jgi:hypothetical protein
VAYRSGEAETMKGDRRTVGIKLKGGDRGRSVLDLDMMDL